MSAADRTLAERSRRHRARQADRQAGLEADLARRVADLVLADLAPLRNALQEAIRAVDNSRAPRSRPGDKALRNGSSDSDDSGALRNGGRAPARARREAPQAPYGGHGGAPSFDSRHDAWRVLQVLTAPASVGALADALDWPKVRVTGALVEAQAQGQVTRTPGEGPRPDRWEAVPLEDLDTHLPRPTVLPAPEVHVTCSDYQAHQAHHRWDQALGAFVCQACPSPATLDVPPTPGVAPVTH